MTHAVRLPDLLPLADGDDEAILVRLRALVVGMVQANPPQELYITRIRRWFSSRWVGFNSKIMGAAGWWSYRRLRVPPFVPSRVAHQQYFVLTPDGYAKRPRPVDLHVEQASERNSQRTIERLTPEALLVWVSGGSEESGQLSIMAHAPVEDGHQAWFARYRRDPAWRCVEHIDITTEALDLWETKGASVLASYAG